MINIIRELERLRRSKQKELDQIVFALKTLRARGGSGGAYGRRKLSAAARARISKAQKARWAKYNAEQKKAA